MSICPNLRDKDTREKFNAVVRRLGGKPLSEDHILSRDEYKKDLSKDEENAYYRAYKYWSDHKGSHENVISYLDKFDSKASDAYKASAEREGKMLESFKQPEGIKGVSGDNVEMAKNWISKVTYSIGERAKEIYKQLTDTPEFTPYKNHLLKWNGNIQAWNQRATGFAVYVKKSLENEAKKQTEAAGGEAEAVKRIKDDAKYKADALTIWREADGNAKTIEFQRDKTIEKFGKDNDLVKGYNAALNLTEGEKKIGTWAGKQFDTLLKSAQERGIIGEGIENYVTHMIDPEGKHNRGYGGKLLADFKYAEKRRIPTLFDAEQLGYKVVSKNIGDVLSNYTYEMGKVIESRDLVENLSKEVGKDGRPLIVPMISGNPLELKNDDSKGFYFVKSRDDKTDYADYKGIENNAFTKWKWKGENDSGFEKTWQGAVIVHPEIQHHLSNVFAKDKIKEWYRERFENPAIQTAVDVLKAADWTQSTTKQFMLSISGFHYVQEGTHALGHWVNPLIGSKDHIDLVNNKDQLWAATHGLMLNGDFESMNNFREGLFSGPLINKIPGIGKYTEMASDHLFKTYIPALKYKTFSHILERNLSRFKKDIEGGKMTKDDIGYLSAQQTNAAFGHQNYVDMGRSATTQHALRMLFLAPDFLEARMRFVGQSTKALFNPMAKSGNEQLRALVTLCVGQWVVARALNGVISYFENNQDPKKIDYHFEEPFSVVSGKRKYGLRSVPGDMMNAYRMPYTFISGRMSPLYGKTLQWLFTQEDYRGQPQNSSDFLKSELQSPIPISVAPFIPGKGNKDIDAWQGLMNAMGLQISRYSKSNEMFNLVKKYKDKHGIADNQKYPPSKFRDVRNHLLDKDPDKALDAFNAVIDDEKKKNPEKKEPEIVLNLAEGLRNSLNRTFTGSDENEKKFKESLGTHDKDTYNRAVKEKEIILNRFNDMLIKSKLPGVEKAAEKSGKGITSGEKTDINVIFDDMKKTKPDSPERQKLQDDALAIIEKEENIEKKKYLYQVFNKGYKELLKKEAGIE